MGEARGEIRIYARCFCLCENSDVRIPPASNSFTNFYFLRNSLGLHIPLPSPRQITSFHRLRRRCRLTVTLNGGRFTSGRSGTESAPFEKTIMKLKLVGWYRRKVFAFPSGAVGARGEDAKVLLPRSRRLLLGFPTSAV